jgi:hypothetical protein
VDALKFSGEGREAAALMKALFSQAPEIEVHEGERINKDAKVIAVEGSSAKP